jgi:hypothetical protein
MPAHAGCRSTRRNTLQRQKTTSKNQTKEAKGRQTYAVTRTDTSAEDDSKLGERPRARPWSDNSSFSVSRGCPGSFHRVRAIS